MDKGDFGNSHHSVLNKKVHGFENELNQPQADNSHSLGSLGGKA